MNMRIGITYDLRTDYLKEGYNEEETAEFDRESTIDGIDGALKALGFETIRIGHARDLMRRLVAGERWDMVFNICEGMYGIGREALVPAILDAYKIPYVFSDPLVLALTLHKGMTKRVVRDAGINTPPFAMVYGPGDIDSIELDYPLFVKPNAEGTGKGIDSKSKVDNKGQLTEVCSLLLPRFPTGLIVEGYLPGREFTIGITGTGTEASSVGIMEVILNKNAEAHSYTYVNKELCDEFVTYRVPEEEAAIPCTELALNAWRVLNCYDGGRVDVRMDQYGVPHFLEVNPLAGLHPEHSDLPIICGFMGIPYTELIRRIMESALQRAGLST
jgi:D-alanine-D-alanine ligase